MTDDFVGLPAALAAALQKVAANLVTFAEAYPHDHTTCNIYRARQPANGYPEGSNVGWTTGFWPGMIWLAYDLTKSPDFCRAGAAHVEPFARRLKDRVDVDHHDLGFLYTLACVAPWRLIGDTAARD